MDNVAQVVSGWIFNADRTRVLIVHNIGGSWSMPGGGVEAGEYLRDAMVREAFEETGLRVRVNRLVAISEGFSETTQKKIVFFGFLLEQTDPKQQPRIETPDEIAEIRWVNKEELYIYLPWLQYCPFDVCEESAIGFYKSVIL